MDENEIMTDVEVMDETEEFEDTDDSAGFPVIPALIGGALLAGGAAIALNRKKIADKFAKARAKHAEKVLEDYKNRSILYNDLEEKDSKKNQK